VGSSPTVGKTWKIRL